MKKTVNVWTLVFKEEDKNPLAFTYTSEDDALRAKQTIQDSDGGELFDEKGNADGCVSLEWCYLLDGKLIEPRNKD